MTDTTDRATAVIGSWIYDNIPPSDALYAAEHVRDPREASTSTTISMTMASMTDRWWDILYRARLMAEYHSRCSCSWQTHSWSPQL